MVATEVSPEIDRPVVGGHAAAAREPAPGALEARTALPMLLATLAAVLLRGAVTRAAVRLVFAYTPPHLVDALVDDNLRHGLLAACGDGLELTGDGLACAEAVVALQEDVIARLWAGADVAAVLPIAESLVVEAPAAPTDPSTFTLFAPTCDRPSPAGRLLRSITAMRYWRADAHRLALAEAGLTPRAAHALNRLWDARRGVDRVGQGFAEPGRKGTADLEARGLEGDGAITPAGMLVPGQVELATDEYTEPLHARLDAGARAALLDSLRSLPV